MKKRIAPSNIASKFTRWLTVWLGGRTPEQYLEAIDKGGVGALHVGKYACAVVPHITCAQKPVKTVLYRARVSELGMEGSTCEQLFEVVADTFPKEVLDEYAPEAALAARLRCRRQRDGEIVIVMTPPIAAKSHPDDARFLVVSHEEARLWLGGIAPQRLVPKGAYALVVRRE